MTMTNDQKSDALRRFIGTYYNDKSGGKSAPRSGNYKRIKSGTPRVKQPTDTTASSAKERNVNVSAQGEVIPYLYGRVQIGARIAATATDSSGNLLISAVWGMGEVQEIESIYANGIADDDQEQIEYTHYLGTSAQTADPDLSSAITGYTDTNVFVGRGGTSVGVCYSVIKLPPSLATSGFPQFTAIVKGLKLYDPRTPGTAYSDNPALALAHLINNSAIGLGLPVDWTSVGEAADYCDELVNGEEARRIIGLAMQRSATAKTWLDTFKVYASVFLWDRGGTWHMRADAPVATFDLALTADDIIANSLFLTRKDKTQLPTIMRTDFTDTTPSEWRDRQTEASTIVGVEAGTKPWRESVLRLPGIQRYSQAYREAIEALLKHHNIDLLSQFSCFDARADMEVGDVVTITHPIGLSAKPFRILSRTSPRIGRYTFSAQEYQDSVYSNDTSAQPDYGDTDAPNPLNPPAITMVGATEEVYLIQAQQYASRLRITWSNMNAAFPWVTAIQIQVIEGSQLIWDFLEPASVFETVTGAVQEGNTYRAQARILASSGAAGPWTETTIVAQGKLLPPSDVQGFSGYETGGQVRLKWDPASDIDLTGYEVRYGAVDVAWASATVVERIYGLHAVINDIAEGQHDFLIKALDSVGNESTNAARATIDVTLDDTGEQEAEYRFTVDDFIDNPTSSNNIGTPPVPRGADYRLQCSEFCSDGGDWGTTFNAAMNTFNDPICSYDTDSPWVLTSKEHDFGVQGIYRFTGYIDIVLQGGSNQTAQLKASTSASSGYAGTADPPAGFTKDARYARWELSGAGATSDYMMWKIPTIWVKARGDIKSETGQTTSSASGGQTVTLDKDYIALDSLTLTVEDGSAHFAVYDNVSLGDPTTFDLHVYQSDGTTRAAKTVSYSWVGS